MARPRKSGLDYFPFDVDFFQNEKVVCIDGEYGLKGVMVAIRLLCAIYRQGYFILWDERLKFKLAKELNGVSAELVENVVHRLVKWGFFDKALFDSTRILTSVGIQRRYFEAVRKREPESGLPYLLKLRKGPETVSAPKTMVSAPETPVSGVGNALNKSKVYKSKSDDLPKAAAGAAVEHQREPLGEPLMEGFIATLRDSPQWLESIARNCRIDVAEIPGWLDSYLLFCRCEGVEHRTLRDVKSHFNRWLPLKIRQSANRNETDQNHPSTGGTGARRGGAPAPGYGLVRPKGK